MFVSLGAGVCVFVSSCVFLEGSEDSWVYVRIHVCLLIGLKLRISASAAFKM